MRMKFQAFRILMFESLLVIAMGLLLVYPAILPEVGSALAQTGNGDVVPKAKTQPTTRKSATPAETSRKTRSGADTARLVELTFWNSIKDSTNPDDFGAYLKKYPDG